MKRLSKQEMREVLGGNPPMCQVNCMYSHAIWCGCIGQGTCLRDPYGLNTIVCNCEGTVTELPCDYSDIE